MTNDIAIIGMGLKFPKADNLREFWERLRDGTDCVGGLPADRKRDADEYVRITQGSDAAPDYRRAAYLDHIDKFDYEFFKIPPKEAALMDPHQRLLLETACHAVNNAGYGRKITGTRTGVFIGFPTEFSATMYQHLIMTLNPARADNSFVGNLPAVLSGRISYFLNVKGPALLIDTSCSSSLAAVHTACRSLTNGDCEMALVGGVNLFVVPTVNKVVENIGIIAPDGRTKSFDDGCDGVGQGEGVGVLLLKPLNDAVRDHDHIHALIKGGAVNQDGKSIGITAPNAAAQGEVIVQAWENAGVDPETITYIETHGTATKLGDPTEILGIRKAFAHYTTRKQFCGIGSVKSNIGHTIGAAGIAGMIKAVLALEQRHIPPSLHVVTPNRKIKFEDSPVFINHRLRRWEGERRRCGVSSFGISGTNAHIVLEEAPPRERAERADTGPHIFTLSATDREPLRQFAKRMAQYIEEGQGFSLADLCYTSNVGRPHLKYRAAVLADSLSDLGHKLIALSGGCDRLPPNVWINEGCSADAAGGIAEAGFEGNLEDEIAVCDSYVQGKDIPWEALYAGRDVYTAPLPDYPFKRTRCWIQTDPQVAARQSPGVERLVYRTVWRCNPPSVSKRPWNGRSVLVFSDRTVAHATLADRLRQQGNKVLEVEFGSTYSVTEEKALIRNIEEDYERLFKHLQSFAPDKFIHLATVSGIREPASTGQLDANLESGVYSLLFIARSLGALKLAPDAELVLVTADAGSITSGDFVQPHNAALIGLGKAVKWEYPQLKCRSIDLGRGVTVNQLMDELEAGGEYQVGLREGRRYVEEVEAVPASAIPGRTAPALREQGTYVLAGGAGRLGIRLAEWMARRHKINLVLLGRSALPPKERWPAILAGTDERESGLRDKINRLSSIEQSGSHVDSRICDITDCGNVRETLRTIRSAYGTIDGVIQLAVSDENFPLADTDASVFTASIRSKVHGTWNLDQETRGDDLSFFILFSSVMTLVSGAGNGTYTLSNAYMDAYAGYRNGQGRATMAMNWPEWEGVGLTVDKQTDESRSIFKKITAEQGLEWFALMLEKNADRLVAGELNVESPVFQLLDYMPFQLSPELKARLKYGGEPQAGASGREVAPVTPASTALRGAVVPLGASEPFGAPDSDSFPARPDVRSADGPLPAERDIPAALTGRNTGEYSPCERALASAWQDVLGYETINVADNFFELGGDSIAAFRLAVVLSSRGIAIEASDILRFQSIESIARNVGNGAEVEVGAS